MQPWSGEVTELAGVVAGVFATIFLLSHHRLSWAEGFRRRWIVILLWVSAAVVLGEVTIEVAGHHTRAIDQRMLVWIHGLVPDGLRSVFAAATLTGSLKFLGPVIGGLSLWLWWRRQRFEALQLAASAAAAALSTYLAKSAFNRPRPDLWASHWYWGSSFPSGHTLNSAAVATALCLCVSRLAPSARRATVVVASVWVAVVALSRLVLGVHWPTDVLAAACAGLLAATGTNALLAAVGDSTGIRPQPPNKKEG